MRPYDTTLKSYIREDCPEDPDYGLCSNCNRIDFAAIFDIDPNTIGTNLFTATMGDPVFRLSHIETATEPSCPLCTIIYSCDVRFVNRLKLSEGDLQIIIRHRPHDPNQKKPFLARGISSSGTSDDFSIWHPVFPKWPAGKRSSGMVDWEPLKSAVQQCIDQHSKDTVSTMVPGMRLIDCVDRCVVDAKRHMEYVALSYVWGIVPFGASGRPSSATVTELLPRTISDAMIATVALGKRYLWVDRYCINQDDHHKQTQINAMGNIYANAWTTIVALGPCDSTGLPGVSIPRNLPSYAQTAYGRVVWPSEHWLNELGGSVWQRRGWTFQEVYLSKRILYFVSTEVLIVCREGVTSESCLSGKCMQSMRGPTDDALIRPLHMSTSLTNIWSWRYKAAFNEFSKRDLTYESDALDAFRGYLSLCKDTSYWGVLVSSSHSPTWESLREKFKGNATSRMFLDWSWRHGRMDAPVDHLRSDYSTAQLCRYPSWSWASCRKTSLSSSYYMIDNNDQVEQVSTCEIFVEKQDRGLINFDDFINLHVPTSPLLPEESKVLVIRAPLFTYHLSGSDKGRSCPPEDPKNLPRSEQIWLDCDIDLPWQYDGKTSTRFFVDQRTCTCHPVSSTAFPEHGKAILYAHCLSGSSISHTMTLQLIAVKEHGDSFLRIGYIQRDIVLNDFREEPGAHESRYHSLLKEVATHARGTIRLA